MGIAKVIATSFVRILPESLRRMVRRRYYRKILKAYRAEDWEWAPVVMPLIPAGGQVFDIGANVGYLSKLFAARVGPQGRVLSVEPIPDTFDVLHHNMSKLFPGTSLVIQACLSDRPGNLQMVVPSYAGGGENFYESHIVANPDNAAGVGRVFSVDATTLDRLTVDLSMTPDFITIDVEGHELSVINGGVQFLSTHKPPLLIEVSGNPDDAASSAAALFNRLSSLGYAAFTRCGDTVRPRIAGDIEVDYLFLAGNVPFVSNASASTHRV